jgi:hypothetical protein
MEKPWHAKTDPAPACCATSAPGCRPKRKLDVPKVNGDPPCWPGLQFQRRKSLSSCRARPRSVNVTMFQLAEHAVIDTGQLDAGKPGAPDRFLVNKAPSRGVKAQSQDRHKSKDTGDKEYASMSALSCVRSRGMSVLQ